MAGGHPGLVRLLNVTGLSYRLLVMRSVVLPLAAMLLSAVAGCTDSGAPPQPSSPVPSQDHAAQAVIVVQYGIGAGDKRVNPSAFGRVTAGRCLAWHDLMARGAGTYEVHLRIPAGEVASTKRSVQMLVKHAAITIRGDAAFADTPTKMADPSPLDC
jgi:hypothetical protein